MADSDLTLKIAFARLHGMNVKLARTLLPRIGSERRFFECTQAQLASVLGFNARILSDAVRNPALEAARREERFVTSNSIKPLYFTDPEYPRALLDCDDAPAMLFMLGRLDLNSVRCLAIVGTRHATVYGSSFTTNLVGQIGAAVEDKVAIVSGLAYGIDVAAHTAALANGVPTVAVLAHGLNTIYPAAHRNIAAEIVSNGGALLTEYTSVEAAHKGNFPARNRIVAGMSEATFVAESDIKGGAMLTARIAGEYGRDVYALPGRVNDRFSRGCNSLIARNMAEIVTEADDFIHRLGWKMRTAEGLQEELFATLNPLEQSILDFIFSNGGECRLSELQMNLGQPTGILNGTLIDMEFRGLINAVPGGRYRLA